METPQLIEAVLRKDIGRVKRILSDKNVKIDERDWKDFSALHYAVIDNNLEMVALLVEEGANIEVESDRWTPIMMASSLGFVRIVKYLIAQGADINKENYMGNSLMWATISGNKHVVQALNAAGALQHLLKNGSSSILFSTLNDPMRHESKEFISPHRNEVYRQSHAIIQSKKYSKV